MNPRDQHLAMLWMQLCSNAHPTVQRGVRQLDRAVQQLAAQRPTDWADDPRAVRALLHVASAVWSALPSGMEAWYAGAMLGVTSDERETVMQYIPSELRGDLVPWLPRLATEEPAEQTAFLVYLHDRLGCDAILAVYLGLAHVVVQTRYKAHRLIWPRRLDLHSSTIALLQTWHAVEPAVEAGGTPAFAQVAALGAATKLWAEAGFPDLDCKDMDIAATLARLRKAWDKRVATHFAGGPVADA